MKTLLALFLLITPCLAQTMQDIDKGKVRMRIKVRTFTLQGAVCDAAALAKNKLGREEVAKSVDQFATKDEVMGRTITVIDLSAQPIKVGEVRDLTLFPVGSQESLYAYTAANALLAAQDKFTLPISPALVEKMGFDAIIAKGSVGQIIMKPADGWGGGGKSDPFGGIDPFNGSEIKLIGAPRSLKLRLYPTAIKDTYATTAADAFKTWQAAKP